DKATMEYESIDDGVLAKIVVPEGAQDVPVNALIAVLAQEGEDLKTVAATATPRPVPKPEPVAAPAPRPAPSDAVPSRPAATAPPSPGHGSDRLSASPLARRLAKESGLDLARFRGSGPHGRIIARDVEAAESGKGAVATAPAIQAPSDDKIRAL